MLSWYEGSLAISSSNEAIFKPDDHEDVRDLVDVLVEIGPVEKIKAIDQPCLDYLEAKVWLDGAKEELFVLLSVVEELVLELA